MFASGTARTGRNGNSVLWSCYEHYSGGRQADERQIALPAAPLSSNADGSGRVARRLRPYTLAQLHTCTHGVRV
jgi:hypothetical protein